MSCALVLFCCFLVQFFDTVSCGECDWLYKTVDNTLYINVDSSKSRSTYPSATTTWSKIRIADTITNPTNIDSVTILTSDFTFSSSSGTSSAHSVTRVPFAAAMACANNQVGQAVIDLVGTPFAVHSGSSQFSKRGYEVTFSRSCTNANQHCEISCAGLCGLCGPASAVSTSESAVRNGGAYLVLDVVDKATFANCIGIPSPTTSPSISPSTEPNNGGSSSSSVGIALGCTAAAIVAIAVLLAVIAFRRKKHTQPHQMGATRPSEIGVAIAMASVLPDQQVMQPKPAHTPLPKTLNERLE